MAAGRMDIQHIMMAVSFCVLLAVPCASQIIVQAGLQCGGLGGACKQGGAEATGGDCVNSTWAGYACSPGLGCLSENQYWWSCGVAPSPNPSPPHSPPPLMIDGLTVVQAGLQCGGLGGNCFQAGGTGGACTNALWGGYICTTVSAALDLYAHLQP